MMIRLLLRLMTLAATVIYTLDGSSSSSSSSSNNIKPPGTNYLAMNESSSPSFRYIFKSAEKDVAVTNEKRVVERGPRGDQWARDSIHQHPAFYDYNSDTTHNHYYDNEDEDTDDDDDDDDEDEEDDAVDQNRRDSVTIDLDDLHSNKPVRVLEFNDYISARNFSFKNRSSSSSSSSSSSDILSDYGDDDSTSSSPLFSRISRWWSRFQFRVISKFLLCTIYIVICLSCVLGNILVILSVFTYRPLQSVQNIFIVSLALADTFVAVFVMPFHIIYQITDGKWLFGTLVCHFFLLLDILLCTSSTLHLCCIALDRYWAIKDSIRYAQQRTMKRVLIMIFITWFLSLVISLPVVIWNTKTVRSVTSDESISSSSDGYQIGVAGGGVDSSASTSSMIVCDIPTDKLYRFYSSSGTFFLPLIVMTFVYVRIYLETKRRLRERARTAQKLAKSMAQGCEVGGGLNRDASMKSSVSRRSGLHPVSLVTSCHDQCLSRICPASLLRQFCWTNKDSDGAKNNAKIGPKNESKAGKKKRSTTKKVIINEINGDTGEKIQTHHQRILSSTATNQESSYVMRECSYVSLNRSIAEDSGESAANSPVSIMKSPPQQSQPQQQQQQQQKEEDQRSEVIANPTSNVVIVVPVFRLEVDEPTKSQDVDEGFADSDCYEKGESKLVEKRSVGTYTKSRKSSKLCPNYVYEEPNVMSTETKTTLNTTSSCSLGGLDEKKPSIRSTTGLHASSWIKENAGAGTTLKERQKISLTRERRAARTLGIIMGAFTVCWMPFFVLYLLQSFHLFLESPRLFEFVTWLGYVNSALNPIIYTIFNLDFRKSFERLLSKCFFSCRPRRQ